MPQQRVRRHLGVGQLEAARRQGRLLAGADLRDQARAKQHLGNTDGAVH
jgi:hypothetical protein